MKNKITFISIISLSFFSCSKKEYDYSVFNSLNDDSIVTTKVYSTFIVPRCSCSLYLNSDLSFLEERGCEGSSDIKIGTWKKINDSSISLYYQSKYRKDLIKNLTYSKSNSKKKKIILLKDIVGNTITDYTLMVFPFNEINELLYYRNYFRGIQPYDQIFQIAPSKNLKHTNFKSPTSDSIFEYYPSKGKYFFIPKLAKINQSLNPFPGKGIADTLEIQLNLNDVAFYYNHISFSDEYDVKKVKITDSIIYLDNDTLTLNK